MPLQATSGAASYDAFGGGVPVAVNYIEDVFQTWLYTGNQTVNTITNGIDLSGKGGMVWIKSRNSPSVPPHRIFDTVRGVSNGLSSNTTAAQGGTGNLSSFNSTGFGLNTNRFEVNEDGFSFASWTFRKQPKFFDVVTYTGTGSNTTISHSLDSVPACIIVKRTDTTGAWQVYHRSLANTEYLVLNTTAAKATGASRWNSTTPTSSVFSLGTDATVNASGGTYVAYLFAHDDGGFGLTGTDNVISCGTFTSNASGAATVNLGYEPQWVIHKAISTTSNWVMTDNMRGFITTDASQMLRANTTDVENQNANAAQITSTGFAWDGVNAATGAANATYIYIAIRRGPMKVPTDATKVFKPVARTGTGTVTSITGFGFSPDLAILADRTQLVFGLTSFINRLRGPDYFLQTSTGTEDVGTGIASFDMDGVSFNSAGRGNSVTTWMNQYLKRAPSFFDIVCYTGTGANRTVSHNLGVVPELMLVKRRSTVDESWAVYSATAGNTKFLRLNDTLAATTSADRWNNTSPTSSVFTVGIDSEANASGEIYINYLFATCSGVSKVGSYTGTGALQTVDCGFSSGARLVIIKRTDSTGDWYIFDSARGITSGNDPYLLLNTATAESTTTNYVDTDSTGFKVTAAAPAGLNSSGGTYIFLAIA